jgi:hypothetical protein
MCFEPEIECRFLSNSDRHNGVIHMSLLWPLIATDMITSLLCYHCSDTLVARDRLSMTTVAYDSMLQCLFVVVVIENLLDGMVGVL